MTTLLQHPLSACFPAMQADEFKSLVESIEEIGVQNPITLYEGMVIDGWHRYRASQQVGMNYPSATLDAGTDPRDFVLAQNKARRHITTAQLAMATTACWAWHPHGGNQHTEKRVDIECPPSKSNRELAHIAGVHPSSIKQAKVVQSHAVAEVQDAVKRGDIGLPKAAAIAKLPANEQVAALNKPLPKPAKPEVEDVAYIGPSEAELQAEKEAAKADLDKIMELMESDDPKAELLKENERLRMELAAVKSQRNGYMNQSNELIRRIKALKKQLEIAQGK